MWRDHRGTTRWFAMSNLTVYSWPRFLPRSSTYALIIDGTSVDVFPTAVADYAQFGIEGRVEVVIQLPVGAHEATLRPASAGIMVERAGDELRFHLDQPRQVMIEIPGLPELFLYANPPESEVPDRDDPMVRWFAAGQVYDIGRLDIGPGQTVYVEGGAVLKGCVNALQADGVALRGRGVIDASHLPAHSQRMIVFEGCSGVHLEGIVTTGTPTWNTVFGACRDVHVDNYKCIGWLVTSDGIDVVGSQDVLIEHCCIRSNDDCIVVKSVSYHHRVNDSRMDWRGDVRNVRARHCVLYNAEAGNAMEIGFETQAEVIEDIVFEDIDVIGAHGQGGVFTIHNGDRAHIRRIRYEDIRIEHFYDKLVDFFIQHSRYSQDDQRGRVSDVVFKRIRGIEDRFNTLSLIGGHDVEHRFENIVFDDFRLGDRHLRCADDLNLYTRHAEGIEFR